MINANIFSKFVSADRSAGLGPRDTAAGRRLAGLLLIVLAMSLGPAGSCRAAGLVIEAPDADGVAPGSSGSFDVLLIDTDPSGSPGYGVSGDSLELTLTGSAGIAFTNVTINTIVPYIYTRVGDDPARVRSAQLWYYVPQHGFHGRRLRRRQPVFPDGQSRRVFRPGERFLLGSSQLLSGTDTITIASLNVGTSLSDINGNLIPFTAMNGSISTAAAIPEPSTLIQAATAVLIGLGVFWRRRHR